MADPLAEIPVDDYRLTGGVPLRVELGPEGDIATRAREQVIEARLGDVRVKANDDVKLNGERIRLNC